MKINLQITIFYIDLKTREYNLEKVESILRSSPEVYLDTHTGRDVKIGKHDDELIIVAYDIERDGSITPVTIYRTSRKQINYYLAEERFYVKI